MTNQQAQTSIPPRRVRPKPRMVTVKSADHLTPACVRVVFTGPELEGFTTKGPAEHLKMLFAQPGQSQPVLPEWGPEGPVLKEGQSFPPSRTYTPRFWRPDTLELTVDFMLHGEGLASDWARNAKAGDVLAVSGQPGGAWAVDQDADWYLLAADASALPGLATILEALPNGKPATVIIEVPSADEHQQLESPANLYVTWLHHGDAAPGALIEREIRDLSLVGGDGRVWVGCEAGTMRSVRRHLLEDRGLDRAQIHTHGYWKAGTANHPDHDVGQDA
jgi:NADPH-dependent ferric siderophore reductase